MSRFFRGNVSSSSDADSEASDSEGYSSSSSSDLDFTAKKKTIPALSVDKPVLNRFSKFAIEKEVVTEKAKGGNSSSEDSYFDQENDSSDSDSDQEVKGLTGRNKWLKRSVLEAKSLVADANEADSKSKPETKRKLRQRQQQLQKPVSDDESEEKPVPVELKSKPVQLTQESLYKQLDQVLEARGKKGTDKQNQVNILKAIYSSLAVSPYQKVRTLLALVPAQFDLASSSTFMAGHIWKE